MIQFLFIWVGFCVGFANALGNNLSVAFLMARILAIFTLHACRVFQKVPTESASHDVIELLEHKLMTIKFMDLFLTLSYGTFPIETVEA